MSQRLWLIGIVADVAAVLAVLAGSTRNIVVVVGAVALLLGTVQLITSRGGPVDKWVFLAVIGIVAGAVTITAVVSRSPADTPPDAGSPTVGGTTRAAELSGPVVQPTATTAPAAPVIGRESGPTPLQLTDDHAVDLDSREPDWDADREAVPGKYDLRYDGGYLWTSEEIAPVKPDATPTTCATAGYDDDIPADDLDVGAAFCVKTTGGAVARIVIRDKGGDPGKLTLDVVVWKKP
ncbi:hypothetical protein FHS29_006791 [Saccharothrix tamanrassetensis]|uniref:Uncharacterized protein n=1 Tax=Saccharothrix tamanrassetensis TaxID=1051531 RepID=A0A841CVK5_9PSEU|nr:hypothetical protein [Saccharothrix tamanrassetensis]MBB5960168.1 hypothetical protein [Saccharothrix tamanrassetensis]